MKVTLRVWRQADSRAKGKMAVYNLDDVSEHMSFLEMLDVLNERLTLEGNDPIAFDSDCREGICGMCGLVINGVAHGPGHFVAELSAQARTLTTGEAIAVGLSAPQPGWRTTVGTDATARWTRSPLACSSRT